MVKLTESLVAQFRVPPGKKEAFLWDDLPGFGVRAFDTGVKSYIIRKPRISLGRAAPGRLTEMRKLASEALARMKLGEDVIAKKKEAAVKKTATLGSLMERYIEERRLELKPRAMEGIELHLRKHWTSLHVRPVDKISRPDVMAVMDGICRDRGRYAADRAKVSLSGFYAWALDKNLCPANPCLSIRRRGTNVSRSRVLSLLELADVWRACQPNEHGRIVKLLLLTGSRRNEIANLQWDEIDFGRAEIILPPARTKNSLVHVIQASAQVCTILREIEPIAGREFLFGEGANAGYQGWSRSKQMLDERINAARAERSDKAIQHWQLHDLRRSFVTHMAEQKLAPPHIIEACINHVSGHKGGVAGIYNRALYSEEKSSAFEAWGKLVAGLVLGR
jgi:integrase